MQFYDITFDITLDWNRKTLRCKDMYLGFIFYNNKYDNNKWYISC